MTLVTTDFVPGKTISESLGIARGNSVRARSLPQDVIALLRHLVGGELHEYTKMMAEAREQALDRLAENAHQMGADAVVNVRFASSQTMVGAAEMICYGTAVKLAD